MIATTAIRICLALARRIVNGTRGLLSRIGTSISPKVARLSAHTFTSESEERINIRLGCFVGTRDGRIGLVERIFSHELHQKDRAFLELRVVDAMSRGRDPVLDLPLASITDDYMLVGLTAVAPRLLYITPFPAGGEGCLLRCDWDRVQFF